MALATNPDMVLLDEPTGGMSREESACTVALIRSVTEGKTLLIVEHDMRRRVQLVRPDLGAGLR